jgi:hypothetical protein
MAVSRPGVSSTVTDAGSASWDSRLIPLLLFGAAAVSMFFRLPEARLGAGFETIAVARSIAAQGQFANPYSTLATGPTAHVAPLYPAFLALLIRIFGYSATFGLVASFCSVIVHGLHAAILPRISEVFFQDRRPGILSALLSIFLPLYFFFPQFEVIYFATALMLFCLASYRLASRGGGWRGLAAGMALGSVALLNPASITVTVPWLAYACWRYLKHRRRAFLLCAALGAVAALAPWTWRNYRQFHAWFLVRDNLGLELFVSNTDGAQATFQQNNLSGLYRSRNPNLSLSETREIARLGEIAYNRQRLAAALAWMRGNPSKFLALSAWRAREFWLPDAEGSPFYAIGIGLVTIASVFAFILLAVRRQPITLFLGATLLLYPIMYYLVENDPRFRAPILWISLLGTGYLLVDIRNRLRPRRTSA